MLVQESGAGMHDSRFQALNIHLEQQHLFLNNHVHSLAQRMNNLIVSTVVNSPAALPLVSIALQHCPLRLQCWVYSLDLLLLLLLLRLFAGNLKPSALRLLTQFIC